MKKKPTKTRPLAKKVAPVKATAGPGFAVEDKVAAACAAGMLLGRSPFPEFPGKLVRIGFQVRPDHWHFEDMLLSFERDAGTYHSGISVRSNQQISSAAFSGDVKDALAAQFTQPEPNPFQRGRDRLALISARHDVKVTKAVLGLCETARGDAAALAKRIGQSGAFSAEARAIYADMQSHLEMHSVPADAATMLASFELVEIDMADFERTEPALGKQLCAELLHDPSETNVSNLWGALVSECQKEKHRRGYLDLERVLAAVRHRFRLKDYSYDRPDWAIINADSRGQLDLVIDTTAGQAVTREKPSLAVRSSLAANPITALVGPSGCGKTSLAKQLLREQGYAVQVWTRASEWPRPQAGTLANALGLPGLTHDLPGLFRRVAGPGLLVMDAVEHCVDADRVTQLARVLRLARPGEADSQWRVLLLVRAEDWSRVREQLAGVAPELAVHVEPIEDYTPEDVGAIVQTVPGLQPLVRQPRLESVLRKPKILALVANHLKAGGSMQASDLAGESHLAQWWWHSQVRSGANLALRARAVDELVAKQAERMQQAVPESAFDLGLLGAFGELVRDGICVSRNQEFAVQHDLFADWARLDLLIRQKEGWLALAAERVASPHWHRAIRLYGIWLLEQADGGATRWAEHVTRLGKGSDPERLIADLFLEAPVLSAAPTENLRAAWSHLAADRGHLLNRMLERMRLTASAPHNALIDFVAKESSFSRDELAAHLRLPYPQYWLPLLVVLQEHAAEAAALAPVAVARVALSWFEVTLPGWAGRQQAAELVVAVGRLFAEGPLAEAYFPDRTEEDMIYRAVLAAAHELPKEVARLARVWAGLKPADGGEYGERAVIIKEGFGPGKGVRYRVPAPWPGGPSVRPKTRFQHVVLRTNAVNPLIAADPAVAREIILALHILEREPERYRERDRFQPEGIVFDDSFEGPFYTRGPYLQLLQANLQEGMRLVVDLVNHYTDRWVEWSRGQQELTVGEGGEAQVWKGDARLYLAYRGVHPCHPYVCSALMALEKALLDRVDRGESVEDDVGFLLKNSRSLAVAGLLVAIGKRVPALLFTSLWPFVASPELQATERRSLPASGERGLKTTPKEQQLRAEWDALPVHQVPLHEACRQLLPYEQAQTKLGPLCARWRKLLEEPAKLTVEEFTLRQLVELFDVANWKKRKEGEQKVWEFEAPALLQEAVDKRRKEQRSDLFPLLTIPGNCRSLLDAGKPLEEARLALLFEELEKVPQGVIPDDSDGDSIIASTADAQCAIIAMLVNLGPEWLDRNPEKAARCGALLLQHLGNPPPSRRHIYPQSPFNLIWENFCGEAAPYFLARDPANKDWRRAGAELAGRSHLETVRAVYRRAAELRAKLGLLFPQLVNLGIWVAAARRVIDGMEHGATPVLKWEEWWPTYREHFVEGTVPEPPETWQKIDVAAGKDMRGSRVDIGTVFTALAPLGLMEKPVDEAERKRWLGWMRQLLAATVAGLPKTVPKSGHAQLPSDDKVPVLFHLGAWLGTIPEPSERRRFWEPLLALADPAVNYIKYFLEAFLGAGCRNPTKEFVDGWKEILAWAKAAEGWKFTAKSPSYEMREAWCSLLGFRGTIAMGSLPPAIVAGAKGFYEGWAAQELRHRGNTQRLLNFLRLPSAIALLPDGLRWVDQSLDVPADQRWGFRELAPEVSSFLQWAWTNHEGLFAPMRMRWRPSVGCWCGSARSRTRWPLHCCPACPEIKGAPARNEQPVPSPLGAR